MFATGCGSTDAGFGSLAMIFVILVRLYVSLLSANFLMPRTFLVPRNIFPGFTLGDLNPVSSFSLVGFYPIYF